MVFDASKDQTKPKNQPPFYSRSFFSPLNKQTIIMDSPLARQGRGRVCVVGASNIDLITYVERLPSKGETLKAHSFHQGFGGPPLPHNLFHFLLFEVTLICMFCLFWCCHRQRCKSGLLRLGGAKLFFV